MCLCLRQPFEMDLGRRRKRHRAMVVQERTDLARRVSKSPSLAKFRAKYRGLRTSGANTGIRNIRYHFFPRPPSIPLLPLSRCALFWRLLLRLGIRPSFPPIRPPRPNRSPAQGQSLLCAKHEAEGPKPCSPRRIAYAPPRAGPQESSL